MKVKELKEALRVKGLPVSGNKAELEQRLANNSKKSPKKKSPKKSPKKKSPKKKSPKKSPKKTPTMTAAELKKALSFIGLKTSGSKTVLAERLRECKKFSDDYYRDLYYF